MNIFLFALASLFILVESKASLFKEWNLFKNVHSKNYASNDEELRRFNIWKSNLDFIKKHNEDADKGLHTFWVKMNKFGDLTSREFGKIYNGYNASLRTTSTSSKYVHIYNTNIKVPDSIDWRTQGFVTPVKDQGQCGSCCKLFEFEIKILIIKLILIIIKGPLVLQVFNVFIFLN
jgi:C1A family cysteine protease